MNDTGISWKLLELLAPLATVLVAIGGLWKHLRRRIEAERTEVLELKNAVDTHRQLSAAAHTALERRVAHVETATQDIPRLITLVERLDETMRDLSRGVGHIDGRIGDVSERLARIEGEWRARREDR